jgi:hypothetical protein
MSSYYQRNKERLLAHQHEYYKNNREKCLVSFKKYYINVLKAIRTIPPELKKKRVRKESTKKQAMAFKESKEKKPRIQEYPKEDIIDPSLVIRRGSFIVSFD